MDRSDPPSAAPTASNETRAAWSPEVLRTAETKRLLSVYRTLLSEPAAPLWSIDVVLSVPELARSFTLIDTAQPEIPVVYHGSEMSERLGADLTGKSVLTVHPESERDLVAETFRSNARNHHVEWSLAHYRQHGIPLISIEWLHLPFRPEGSSPDAPASMILIGAAFLEPLDSDTKAEGQRLPSRVEFERSFVPVADIRRLLSPS